MAFSRLALFFCIVSLPAIAADTAERSLIQRYVGTWDVSAFLAEPAVHEELQSFLGDDLAVLHTNLSVTGPVGYYGGGLMVMGNAPHRGTEDEAIVCVQQVDAHTLVHAAVYASGAVVVYSRQPRYEYLPTCIKDWVTLVSARHVARLRQPGNVRMSVPVEADSR